MSAPPIDVQDQEWRVVRDILRAHVPEREVWAFGSRARRSAKTHSDLDLAVISDQPLDADVAAAMAEAFADSELAFKVDIVDWALTAETFRDVIRGQHVVIQEGARAAP